MGRDDLIQAATGKLLTSQNSKIKNKFIQTLLHKAPTSAGTRVQIPHIPQYRNCIRYDQQTAALKHNPTSLCNEKWYINNNHFLISNQPGDGKGYRLCRNIIREVQDLTRTKQDCGDDEGCNLHLLLQDYRDEYKRIFNIGKEEINLQMASVQRSDTKMRINNQKINTNMENVSTKEKILNKLKTELINVSAMLLSNKTQENLHEHDRVRIGAQILPLFYVRTKHYVFGMMFAIVVLLAAIIIYVIMMKKQNRAASTATPNVQAEVDLEEE